MSKNPFADPPDDTPYAPPRHATPIPTAAVSGGDSTGGLIPYKNAPALIAYYLGIFSIIPCFGLLLAVPAVVLGIMGLKKRKQNPEIKGSVHAWIGIIAGSVFTLIWGTSIIAMIIAMAREF